VTVGLPNDFWIDVAGLRPERHLDGSRELADAAFMASRASWSNAICLAGGLIVSLEGGVFGRDVLVSR